MDGTYKRLIRDLIPVFAAVFMLTGCGAQDKTLNVTQEEAEQNNILKGYIMQTEVDQETGQIYRYIEIPGTVMKKINGDTIKQYCEINSAILDKIVTDETEYEVETDYSTIVTPPADGMDNQKSTEKKQTKKEEPTPKISLASYEVKEEKIKEDEEEVSESSGDNDQDSGSLDDKKALETSGENENVGEGETGKDQQINIPDKKRAYIRMPVDEYQKLSRKEINEYLREKSKEYEYFTILLDDGSGICIRRDQNEYTAGPVDSKGIVTEVHETYNVDEHSGPIGKPTAETDEVENPDTVVREEDQENESDQEPQENESNQEPGTDDGNIVDVPASIPESSKEDNDFASDVVNEQDAAGSGEDYDDSIVTTDSVNEELSNPVSTAPLPETAPAAPGYVEGETN